MKIDLFLASKSPRRSELLSQIGIPFTVLAVDIDEKLLPAEKADDYVLRLAKEKALAGLHKVKLKTSAIIGSDTVVVINDQILGKPDNHSDAKNMLTLLSGKTHQVMTAVALAIPPTNGLDAELTSIISVSKVTFKNLSDLEIEQYINSGECDDKAGSYGIQGKAAIFITHLSGSYSGVMGLPLYETVELLKNAGIGIDSLVVS